MRTFLLGNSIVADVRDPQWTTICRPGENWEDLVHYVIRNRVRFINSFVYILIGPVRFTRLHRTRGRRECVLSDYAVGSPQSWFRLWLQHLLRDNIIPVLCTVYPLDFTIYNNSIRRERLLLEGWYQEWTQKLKSMVVVENRLIVNFNVRLGMATPFIHRRIFHRRQGGYTFRVQYLADGLHPTPQIVHEWILELRRVNHLNRLAWRSRQNH